MCRFIKDVSYDGPLREVVAVVGGEALLPCDVTEPGDSPILVLFYNGATGRPVYSIDSRSGPLDHSVHWSGLGVRAKFDLTSPTQSLVISPVEAQDEGDYRCRVDFRASPTRNLRVKLAVIVPPRKVSIINSAGLEVSGVIGPYPVGGGLVLTCRVLGGKGSMLGIHIKESVPPTRHIGSGKPPLSRFLTNTEGLLASDLGVVVLLELVCFRIGTEETADISRQNHHTEALKQETGCSWKKVRERVERREPGAWKKRLGHRLVCETPSTSRLEQEPRTVMILKLDHVLNLVTKTVNYIRGRALNHHQLSQLLEVMDNDFIDAPFYTKVRWLSCHRVLKRFYLLRREIILYVEMKGQDLAKLYRPKSAGYKQQPKMHFNYNRMDWIKGFQSHEGTVIINDNNNNNKGRLTAIKQLTKRKWTYGSARGQQVNVTCGVDAHPEAHTFRWAFNTSTEVVYIPKNRTHFHRNRSVMAYTPKTHHDFGTLLCWAVNEVGPQPKPCVYLVVPAAVPEPVRNCSVWHNASAAGEVVVSCEAGWSGGLTQTFTLEVRQLKSSGEAGVVVGAQEQQHTKPHFTVTGLAPGTEYQLSVGAWNSQGAATATVLLHHTSIDVAERRTSAAAAESFGVDLNLLTVAPIVAVVSGAVASLVLCSVVLALVIRSRLTRSRNHSHNLACNQPGAVYDKAASHAKSCDDGGFDRLQREPDLILVKGGECCRTPWRFSSLFSGITPTYAYTRKYDT
ncbi:uncharacterized protein [Procambarus clarkii]|uniref:uncharacterized protein n=1 Tax=Procambarus clarkii TaxID=6728 RepID=UPI0037426E83